MLAIAQFGSHLQSLVQQQEAQVTAQTVPQTAEVIPLVAGSSASSVPLQDSGLQTLLQNWGSAHSGQDWSVVVKGLDSNRFEASTRANSWYVPASLYKVMMTYTLFSKVNMDSMRGVTLNVDGKQQTLDTCVDNMLRYSDNPCADAVGKYLGWWRVEEDLHKLGLGNTFVNRKDTMFSTAEDTANYIQQLYEGKLFGERERNYVLSTLKFQKLRSGIPKGCEGCVVANKTGDLGNVRHDVGIIESHGRTYLLSIFTSGAPYTQIAELTKQINFYLNK